MHFNPQSRFRYNTVLTMWVCCSMQHSSKWKCLHVFSTINVVVPCWITSSCVACFVLFPRHGELIMWNYIDVHPHCSDTGLIYVWCALQVGLFSVLTNPQAFISICSYPVCYRWCLCAGDQTTMYISMVCVSYGGWWLGDWIKVSIKASNSKRFFNGLNNAVMVFLESLYYWDLKSGITWTSCCEFQHGFVLYTCYTVVCAPFCVSDIIYRNAHAVCFIIHVLVCLVHNSIKIIGASLSEPHTGQAASPAIYDLSIYRTSFRK